MKRRDFLVATGSAIAGGAAGGLAPAIAHAASKVWQPAELAEGTVASSVLEALPGKVALLKRAYRPPNYETPLQYFRTVFTQNNAFFVRWHLASIPTVNLRDWKLKLGGEAANKPFELDMAGLKRDFEQVEIAAVCLCSGNRRGMFAPHVAGVEWGIGAMGNAVWKGVRLRELLNRAGVKAGAVEVAFNGADAGVVAETPDFVKSIPIERALDENTLVAYEMNGKPLPHFNGFPARLVVPGWTGTYWMKQLTQINVLDKPQGGFWMNAAYRLPTGRFPKADRFSTQENQTNTPITDIVVNSLVTSMRDGARFRVGQTIDVAGIAWDGGRGIREVQVSPDSGSTWHAASLGKDYGRYSFRQFSYKFKAAKNGAYIALVKATNSRGDSQVMDLVFNPAGYHHNVIERIQYEVVGAA